MKNSSFFILLLFVIALVGSSCTNNDDQNRFEAQAYSLPEGYTETDTQSKVLNTDDDDWRISPLYIGLIRIFNPAFPNPVDYGSQFEITVRVDATPAGSSIQLYYFNTVNTNPTILDSQPVVDDFTDVVFRISTNQFGTATSARGLHRLLLLDGNQRIISYGDLLIK